MGDRRRHGTGSITDLKNGRHRVVAPAGRDPATGKRRQVVRIVDGSHSEAQRVLTGLMAEINKGGHAGTTATVAMMLDRYMREVEGEIADRTWDDFERVLRLIVRPRIGALPLSKVTTIELDRMWAWATERGFSRHRQRKAATALSNAFRYAVRWTWVKTNPVPDAKPKAPARTKPRVPPDIPVLKALLELVESDPEMHTWLRLVIAMGARRNEVLALRWPQVDIDAAEIRVDSALSYSKRTGVTEKSTKTNKERTVSLDDASLEVIRAWRDARPDAVDAAGFVLAADLEGRRPWFPDSASRRFRVMRARVPGAEHVQLRDLRNAAATHMLNAGVPVGVAADRLGHDPVVLYRHYAGTLRESERAAARKMGDLLA